VRRPKKTAGMGAARVWKHRFFCPFLVTSFGQAKEVKKEKMKTLLNLVFPAKRSS
jgi:hypothetical protein